MLSDILYSNILKGSEDSSKVRKAESYPHTTLTLSPQLSGDSKRGVQMMFTILHNLMPVTRVWGLGMGAPAADVSVCIRYSL